MTKLEQLKAEYLKAKEKLEQAKHAYQEEKRRVSRANRQEQIKLKNQRAEYNKGIYRDYYVGRVSVKELAQREGVKEQRIRQCVRSHDWWLHTKRS